MNSSYRTAGRGTPDGTRTHRKTHFECAVSANSTTGAYCDSFYELPNVWCPKRDLNPYAEALVPKASMSANSTIRAWCAYGDLNPEPAD